MSEPIKPGSHAQAIGGDDQEDISIVDGDSQIDAEEKVKTPSVDDKSEVIPSASPMKDPQSATAGLVQPKFTGPVNIQEVEMLEIKKEGGETSGSKPQEQEELNFKRELKDTIPFNMHYRKMGVFGRLFYRYADPLLDAMNVNDKKMKEEMIIEMTNNDTEDAQRLEEFLGHIARRDAEYRKAKAEGKDPNYYYVVRGAFLDTFFWQFVGTAFYYFLSEFLGIAYAATLSQIVEYLQDPDAPKSEGAILICIFASFMFFQAIVKNHYFIQGAILSINIRKTLISALYNKVQKLSIKSMTETNSGKLITIVSGDIQAIERSIAIIPTIVAAPFVNIAAYIILWIRIGWEAALITFGVWVVSLIFQHYTSELNKTLKLKESVINDERLKLVNDMIIGARTIKSYGWEDHYLNKIISQRTRQMWYIFAQGVVISLGISIFQNMGLVAVLLIIIPKWNSGELLEEGTTIALLAMLFLIFMSVNTMVYFAMTTTQTFLAIILRIGNIFEMDEYKFRRQNELDQQGKIKDPQINFENASFTWGFKIKQKQAEEEAKESPTKKKEAQPKKEEKPKQVGSLKLDLEGSSHPILSNLNLNMKPGDFITVVGRVGSGKTSLLMSVMEETILQAGSQTVKGSVAYVEQEPFIVSDTVMNNIMFGNEYDEEKLKRAVRAAQMASDINLFTKGINTTIGERGVNVSGGQKARISLARAVYSDADIILLDDPLSAVDPEVANKIFHECIMGALKDKIVILVTHQLQFLKHCPKILLLTDDGDVMKMGTYDEINETGFNINEILDSYNQAMKDNDQKTDKKVFKQEDKTPTKKEENLKEDKEETDDKPSGQDAAPVINKATPEEPKKGEDGEEKKDEEEEEAPQDLIVAEDKIEGSITIKDFQNMFSFSIGTAALVIYAILSVLCALLQLAPSYLLSAWTKLPLEEQQEEKVYMVLFIVTSISFMLIVLLRSAVATLLILKSTTGMHNKMSRQVLRSKIVFFDSNPQGRIVTRFAKDMTIIDVLLAPIGVMVTQGILRAASVVITVSIINPILLVFAVLGSIYMVKVTREALAPMVEAQRFEQMFYGPINSTMANVINGMTTLRGYHKFSYMKIGFLEALFKSANSTFSFNASSRWIGLRLDALCAVFGIATAIFTLVMKGEVERELLTFSLTIITDVVVLFSISIRMFAEMENIMSCSQRVYQYTELESEDELRKKTDDSLSTWPKQGEIAFNNVTMAYREKMKPAVRGLSFKAQPGMKVGVVGRTGSGKSSILQILFRLSEHSEGSVMIDGVDIKSVGLHTLRKNIGYIPQAPFLIQGSIRENIDPFKEFTEEQVISVLKEVKLMDHIERNCENGIFTIVTESNSLFSLGQRQLLCLARAMIRKASILVLDEATANVDLETDNFIQEKLKDSFQDCTVIIIAHRLATVIDADRILVMNKGQGKEFDHPFNLLANSTDDNEITKKGDDGEWGFFAKMVRATGDETAKSLFQIAKDKFMSIECQE